MFFRKSCRFFVGLDDLIVRLGIIDQSQRSRIVNSGDLIDIIQLLQISKGQSHQQNNRQNCSGANKGRTASALSWIFIGKCSEQWQKEQSKNIIQCHDRTRPKLAHAKFIGQNQRNNAVVSLPKRQNQKESKAYIDGTLRIQLHRMNSFIFTG